MLTSSASEIRVGITMGDPAGIGPEIILKALPLLSHTARICVIGDAWVLGQVRGVKRSARYVDFVDIPNVSRRSFRFGCVKAAYGRASLDYLDRALELLRSGAIDCLVTAPISKEAIARSGCRFTGHTEYLSVMTETPRCAMMLLSGALRFILATRHIPLRDVSTHLDALAQTVGLAFAGLRELFGIRDPRMVVCGLNPHASDNGLIGREEKEIVAPVVRRLRKKMHLLEGPIAADVAIARARGGAYDGVIALYHDQALIPLKLLGCGAGVNLTLGLPFVRTSPLHGTAFDIAGRNQASASSLIEAVRTALDCTRRTIQKLRK